MEPMNSIYPKDNFLKVRDLASKNGILLIFDEIITGFRFSIGALKNFLMLP